MFSRRKNKKEFRKKRVDKRLSPIQFQVFTGIVLILAVALLVAGIFYGTRLPQFQITDIVIVGGETIPHEEVTQKVTGVIDETYIRLIPKRFIPLLPKSEIENALLSFDRIKNTQISVDNQVLTIVFEEYVPYALWCEEKQSTSCFFIDTTGYAFAPAPKLQGSAFVRYIEIGTTPELDRESFSRTFIDETKQFITLLEEHLSLFVTHVVKEGDLDIEYTIAGGGILKVSQNMSIEDSFENLESILQSETFKHLKPGGFQYIDLRFGEKIFVNEKTPSEASTSTATTSQ